LINLCMMVKTCASIKYLLHLSFDLHGTKLHSVKLIITLVDEVTSHNFLVTQLL